MAGETTLDERKWAILSNKLKVAAQIQILDEAGSVPYHGSISRELEKKGMKPTTIHNAINRLIDLGSINAEWVKVDSRWVRRFKITGESKEFIETLVKELYK